MRPLVGNAEEIKKTRPLSGNARRKNKTRLLVGNAKEENLENLEQLLGNAGKKRKRSRY